MNFCRVQRFFLFYVAKLILKIENRLTHSPRLKPEALRPDLVNFIKTSLFPARSTLTMLEFLN
jgi:hypothetical protein